MSVPSRRFVLRAAGLVLAACVLVAAGACALFREIGVGGDDARWQTAHFKGISAGDVLRLAQTAIRREYPLQRVDSYHGDFESGWVYGLFDEIRRHPLRQRIVVEAKPEEGLVMVRLRAQQEVNETAGRLASGYDDGWEKFDDDPIKAQTMMERLCILLKEVGELVPETGPDAKKS